MPDPTDPILGDDRYGDSLKSKTDSPDLDSAEKRFGDEKLFAALRDAAPSAFKTGKPLFPSPVVAGDLNDRRRTDFPAGTIRHHQPQEPFPPETNQTTTTTGGTSVPNITFICSDATVNEGSPPVPSNKVLVADGKIDSQFPSGMGFGEYILDLADPSDSLIYAAATFTPTSLALTSRFLGVSGSGDFPESRVESATEGFLYWLLAFTYFDGDGVFKVVNVRVGDIYTELIYGSQNGQPALWAGAQIGWLDLNLM